MGRETAEHPPQTQTDRQTHTHTNLPFFSWLPHIGIWCGV